MSLLNDLFQMTTKDPLPGGYGGIWDVFVPDEIAQAATLGTGAGQPNAQGTVQPGTIPPGMILSMTTTGTVVPAVSGIVTTGHTPVAPQLFWVAMEGDEDYSSSYAGQVTCCHGGMRIETTQFTTGQVYTPGAPLIVGSGTAGLLYPKTVGDHLQIVGIVGPKGVDPVSGVLDAYLVQGIPTAD